MKKLFLLFLSLIIISCSSSKIPFGIRKTIVELDNELSDTTKYDFKIAPERIATNKYNWSFGLHTPNGHNIKGQKGLLKLYFKLNGVSDSYHMSEIIRTTYHRHLNNQPLKFREQTKYYKKYEKLLKKNMDTAFAWDERNKPIKKYKEEEKDYFKLYQADQLVTGTIMAWKKYESSSSGTYVEFIGRVISLKERDLFVELTEIAKPKNDFKLTHKVGDTIKQSPYSVVLIPNK